MEYAVREVSVAGARRRAGAEASEHCGGRTPRGAAVATAGTKDRGLCSRDETSQRDRRHAERVGASARDSAGALSRFGQGSAAELFCGRGLQRETMDQSQSVGAVASAIGNGTRSELKERRGRLRALVERAAARPRAAGQDLEVRRRVWCSVILVISDTILYRSYQAEEVSTAPMKPFLYGM